MSRSASRARRPAPPADEEGRPRRSGPRTCPACKREFEGTGTFCPECSAAAGLAPSV